MVINNREFKIQILMGVPITVLPNLMKWSELIMEKSCIKCGATNGYVAKVKTWNGNVFMCPKCQDDHVAEIQDRNDLLKYIKEKHKLSVINGHIAKHIKELHTDKGFSYKELKYIFYYYHEIEKGFNPNYAYTTKGVDKFIDAALAYAEFNDIDINEFV